MSLTGEDASIVLTNEANILARPANRKLQRSNGSFSSGLSGIKIKEVLQSEQIAMDYSYEIFPEGAKPSEYEETFYERHFSNGAANLGNRNDDDDHMDQGTEKKTLRRPFSVKSLFGRSKDKISKSDTSFTTASRRSSLHSTPSHLQNDNRRTTGFSSVTMLKRTSSFSQEDYRESRSRSTQGGPPTMPYRAKSVRSIKRLKDALQTARLSMRAAAPKEDGSNLFRTFSMRLTKKYSDAT